MFILAILSVIGAITYGIIQHLFIVEHEITQPTHTREGYQMIKNRERTHRNFHRRVPRSLPHRTFHPLGEKQK